MKKELFVLLAAALLIPGAAAAESAGPACLVTASDAAVETLFSQPLQVGEVPGNEVQIGDELPGGEALPEGEVSTGEAEGRENVATPGQAPACPVATQCNGGINCTQGACTYTSTGSRCCYLPSLSKYCCPVGTKVHLATCPCFGCNNNSRQTALCL